MCILLFFFFLIILVYLHLYLELYKMTNHRISNKLFTGKYELLSVIFVWTEKMNYCISFKSAITGMFLTISHRIYLSILHNYFIHLGPQ